MQEMSMSEFTYPGTEKWPNQGSYGGFNYSFKNGWVVSLAAGGNDKQTLCFVSFRGLVHDIREVMGNPTPDEYDDKRYLNRREITSLFERVSTLPDRALR